MPNDPSTGDKYASLKGIRFVGDLSLEDASVLVEAGRSARRILEFGAGGSTQIFAQCMPKHFVSVETDPEWIRKTEQNLSRIQSKTKPEFVPYDLVLKAEYDLIFVDGVDQLRRSFAIRTWPWLSVGGVMVFHDTRRLKDFENVAFVAQSFFSEVRSIEVNVNDSNITLVKKRIPLPYVNWNYTEGKPLWAYGSGEVPKGEDLWTIA